MKETARGRFPILTLLLNDRKVGAVPGIGVLADIESEVAGLENSLKTAVHKLKSLGGDGEGDLLFLPCLQGYLFEVAKELIGSFKRGYKIAEVYLNYLLDIALADILYGDARLQLLAVAKGGVLYLNCAVFHLAVGKTVAEAVKRRVIKESVTGDAVASAGSAAGKKPF